MFYRSRGLGLLVMVLMVGCSSNGVTQVQGAEAWEITNVEDSAEWLIPEGYEVLTVNNEFAFVAAIGTPMAVGSGCLLVGRVHHDPCGVELEDGESRFTSDPSGSPLAVSGLAGIRVQGEALYSRAASESVSARADLRLVGGLQVPVFEIYGRDQFVPVATGSLCPSNDPSCVRLDSPGCELKAGRIDCNVDSTYLSVTSGILRRSELEVVRSEVVGSA